MRWQVMRHVVLVNDYPPSSDISPVRLSRTTAAVKPTPELPLPVVYTPRGATVAMYLRSYRLYEHQQDAKNENLFYL